MSVRTTERHTAARPGKDVWAPVETAPYEEVRSLQEARLREQLAYLKARSPFYADVLQEVDPRSVPLKDVPSLPFTTKEQLRESQRTHPPLGLHQAATDAEVIQVHTTSGTSGVPAYIGLTARDLDDWCDIFARGFWASGLRRADTVLHAFAMSRGYAGAVPMIQAFLYMGVRILPFGVEAGTDRLLDAIGQLRATCLYASPSFARHLAEGARERGIDIAASSIRLLMSGGEPGIAEGHTRHDLEIMWGAEVRELMGGSDVCPLLWAECSAEQGMHQIAPDLVLTEFIDPETGKTVWEPETGAVYEIAYTHLRRQATPLVRFRQADLVEVRGHGCDCGRTGIRIRGRGRSDDLLIVKGVKLFPSAIADIVLQHRPLATGEMRVVRPRSTHVLTGPVEVRVEVADTAAAGATFVEALERAIHERLSVRARVVPVPTGHWPTGAPGAKVRYIEILDEEGSTR